MISDLSLLIHLGGHIHKQTLDIVGVPMYLANRTGVLLWVNTAATALHGDAVGRPFSCVIAPEISYAHRQFARKIIGEATTTTFDLLLLDKGGSRVPAWIHLVRLPPNDSDAAVFAIAIPSAHAPPKSATADDQQAVQLTERQYETLLLLGDGLGTSDIATRLTISRETARNHIRAVMSALGVHSRLEAVVAAHRIGLLPPPT